MTTTTTTLSDAPSFPIVVALTDDILAPTILRVVHALVREHGATPTIVEVAEVAMHAGWEATLTSNLMIEELLGPNYRSECERDLRARYTGPNGILPSWRVDVRIGDAPAQIRECAATARAQLIVMGLNQHGRLARALGENTTQQVMRQSAIPVLAIRSGLETAPSNVVAAMDFSEASVRAARLALRIMDGRGVLHLVHVRSALLDDDTEQSEGIRLVHSAGVKAAFSMIIGALDIPPGVTVRRVTLDGDAVAELRLFASRAEADLIAIGSQRHRWLERHLIGSVATAIVSDGRWSTLVTPPALRPDTSV